MGGWVGQGKLNEINVYLVMDAGKKKNLTYRVTLLGVREASNA